MITLAAMILGFGFGWWRAVKRGGARLDKLQYAGSHALFFGVVVLIASAIAARLLS